jgi:hypothetical protein
MFVFAVLISWDLGWALPGCEERPEAQSEAAQSPPGGQDRTTPTVPGHQNQVAQNAPRRTVGILNVKQRLPVREAGKHGLPAASEPNERQPPPGSGADEQRAPWWEEAEHWTFWDHGGLKRWERDSLHHRHPDLAGSLLFGYLCSVGVVIIFLLVKAVVLVGNWISSFGGPKKHPRKAHHWLGGEILSLLASLLAGFAGGALLYFVYGVLLRGVYWQAYDVAFIVTVGPALAVAIVLVSINLAVGLLGRVLQEDDREWWGSLGGWLLILTCAWVLVVGLSLFGPVLLMAIPASARALLGSGWAATALAAVLAGKNPQTGTGKSTRPAEWLARLGPAVFLIGFLILVALLLDAIQMNVPPALGESDYSARLEQYFKTRWSAPLVWLVASMLVAVGFAMLVALRVDVNLFSLHGLYADRLVRCYLGASRPKARENIDRLRGRLITAV